MRRNPLSTPASSVTAITTAMPMAAAPCSARSIRRVAAAEVIESFVRARVMYQALNIRE